VAPVLPVDCPKVAPIPNAPRVASVLSACQIMEARQDEALSQLTRAHPEVFSREHESDEPLLDVTLFRRCQRVRSGAVGLVPLEVEPSGVVTLRAVLVDGSGKEQDSAPIRVEPQDWMVLEAEKEPVVVVTSLNVSACRDDRPCTSSEAFPLRFGKKDAILAPLAERWLGTTAPIVGADDDSPLPWWLVSLGTERKGALAIVHFRWPSLRLGSHLIEGVGADVEVDETLGVLQSTLDSECQGTAPLKSAVRLWQSAQCERLKGASMPVVLAELRARCEKVLSALAQGKPEFFVGEDLCVDAADRPWLSEKEARLQKPRPAVRIAPEVANVLARIGPAQRFVKAKESTP
jgi:hypothetical protein